MQKARVKTGYGKRTGTLVYGALLLLAPVTCQASGGDGSSIVTGVVRDAHGVVQMGVLVQVLAPGLGTIGSAFTDEHGRYVIDHLLAGNYRVRATATLFAPATRPVLQLSSGGHAVVNLTMAALFDTASWLPAERRRPDESDDDWKWTLRSSANRPILRMAGQDDSQADSTPKVEAPARRPVHGSVALRETSGLLGQVGPRNDFLMEQKLTDGTVATVRLVSAEQPSDGVDAAFAIERSNPYGAAFSTRAAYRSLPNLQTGVGEQGIQELRIASAQQAALGEWVTMEAGGEVEAVRAGDESLLAAHPFLRLVAKPGGSWRVEYRLATERSLQGYADARADQDAPAAAASSAQSLIAHDAGQPIRIEKGEHQQISLTHDVPTGQLEVTYYQDRLGSILLSGVNTGNPVKNASGLITENGTGAFAVLANGYSAGGASVSYTAPLPAGIWIVAAYSFGDALTCQGSSARTVADALQGVRPRSSQAAMISLRGHLHDAGTQIRASYRWQTDGTVSAVDPYNALSEQAFLSVFARQPLRFGSWMPGGMEATIDVSNLLAEGYRPFLSADGHTLYLAQTPRTVQVGLAFNF